MEASTEIPRGKLYEFGEVDNASIQTKVSLQVELVDRKTNRNVWDRVVEREEPVSSKNVTDVVQSLDRNLQHVVSETAAEIDKFLAAARWSIRADRRRTRLPFREGWWSPIN